MAFSWDKIPRPIVALAPMAGYTDSAYRQIVKRLAPEVICFSELTSTDAISHNNEKTLKMLDFDQSEYPLIMQIFGKKAEFFVEAGKRLESLGIAAIDINMGCPARKVIYSEQGSALLKNPELAAEIVHKLSKSIKIPVSVKTRLGFDSYDPERLINFGKLLEQAGAKLITLHSRTTKQGYSGTANFEAIYLLKQNLKIPVIGNGDITSAEIAAEKLSNNDKSVTLDGLMIGRSTIGNPWLIAEIYAKLHGKKYSPPENLKEKIALIKDHFVLSIKTHGKKIGLLEMRKHLGNYIRGIENAGIIRQKIMAAKNETEVLEILGTLA